MRLPLGILLTTWIIWGGLLVVVALLAWMRSAEVKEWLAAWQTAYGLGAYPAWILRTDTHLHIAATCLLALWFGLGCRLFAPRALPWLPVALTVLVALLDELCQLGSASRQFGWGDQAADAVGLIVAFPLLLLLPRLQPVQSAAASSAAKSVRS
jgi:hypothetical protein